MKNIRETITALTAGDSPGGVRVNRKEHEPMNDERFRLILKCIVSVTAIIAGTVLVLNLDPDMVFPLMGLICVGGLIYVGIREIR